MARFTRFAPLFSLALLGACGDAAPAIADPPAPHDAATVDAPQRDDATAPDATAPDASAPDATAPDATPPNAACAARAVPSGTFERTVRSGGVDRTFLVHVPRGYDPTRAAMVVLNFHGFLSNAAEQAGWSNMNAAADTRGFLAVHPQGRDTSWNAGVCCGPAQARGDDDVAFVHDVIDALEREFCVDTRRVFATGFSNGAFLAQRLACELSGRIAAIAPVSGLVGVATCAPVHPMPVLEFHGDSDLVVPYAGSPLLGFTSVAASAQGWATRDGCGATTTDLFRHGDAACVSYAGCAGGAEVVQCTVTGGGHTWPGGGVPVFPGGYTSRDLDATSFMLDFFDRHPMPAR